MVELLARLINGEARGESYLGQVAVGAVIMNRVKSSSFPNSIAGVIYQRGAFAESLGISGSKQGTEGESIHGTDGTGSYHCRQ